MSDTVAEKPPASTDLQTPVLQRLPTLDRFLPVGIVAAMALGLILGRAFPEHGVLGEEYGDEGSLDDDRAHHR